MKKFTFVYQPISGGSDSVTLYAKNYGIAINRFKHQYKYLKIIKIVKEKKENGTEE